jgi:hypothetical protein
MPLVFLDRDCQVNFHHVIADSPQPLQTIRRELA